MRAFATAALAAVLSAPSPVLAASAEPELIPVFPEKKRPLPPPRVRAAAPPLEPEAPERPPEPAPEERPYERRLPRDEERAAMRRVAGERPIWITRARVWFAKSENEVRYSNQVPRDQVNPPGDVFLGETDQHSVSGALPLFSVEIAPLSWLGFEFEVGEDRRDGRYAERYWVHAPGAAKLTNLNTGGSWEKPDHEDDFVLEAGGKTRRQWTCGNVHFRVSEGRVTGSDEVEVRHALDITLGAHRFRQDSNDSNFAVTRSDGKIYGPFTIGPRSGLQGRYEAQWSAAHLGFREEMTLSPGLSFDGVLLYSPLVEYRGDGYQNYFGGRSEPPNFTDRARGSALHFRLGAAWTYQRVRVEAGWMRLSFMSHGGKRRYYFNDGSEYEQALDRSRAVISGAYLGASLRF